MRKHSSHFKCLQEIAVRETVRQYNAIKVSSVKKSLDMDELLTLAKDHLIHIISIPIRDTDWQLKYFCHGCHNIALFSRVNSHIKTFKHFHMVRSLKDVPCFCKTSKEKDGNDRT